MIQQIEWDRFFEKFSERGNISEACAASGISRTTFHAYSRGEFPEGVDGTAWKARLEEARESAVDRLESEAFRRAHDGWIKKRYTKPGDHDGGIVEEWAYSDTLMVLLLKANRPDKYKDRSAQEVSGPGGKPIQTETKVIAVPAIEEDSPE